MSVVVRWTTLTHLPGAAPPGDAVRRLPIAVRLPCGRAPRTWARGARSRDRVGVPAAVEDPAQVVLGGHAAAELAPEPPHPVGLLDRRPRQRVRVGAPVAVRPATGDGGGPEPRRDLRPRTGDRLRVR